MDKWTNRFMALAEEAASWSKDPDCQVGAVIVSPDKRLFTIGYNGFPIGVCDEYVFTDKEDKLELTVHAEVNAIVNSRRDLSGWSMYCTKAPCLVCAKAMIQAGISQFYCHAPDPESSWYVENMKALRLLNSVGIRPISMMTK
jgi:dCMP deaminase